MRKYIIFSIVLFITAVGTPRDLFAITVRESTGTGGNTSGNASVGKSSGSVKSSSVSPQSTAVRGELKTMRDAFQKNAVARSEALVKKLGRGRGEKVERLFNRLVTKVADRIKRFGDLAERVQKKITDMETSDGRDVAPFREKLSQGRGQIIGVEKLLERLKAEYSNFAGATSLPDAFKKVEDSFRPLEEKLRDIHKFLAAIVVSIKE